MPFLIALAGIAAAVYFFVIRARNAADVAHDVVDMANDVRLAARRFGFVRRTNVHPVESIDDPRLAIAALATAFLELDDLPTAEQRAALTLQLRTTLRADTAEAEEMSVLGHWFVSECGGPQPAIARLSRKLMKQDGVAQVDPLLTVLGKITGPAGLSDKQRDALDDIKRAFRIK